MKSITFLISQHLKDFIIFVIAATALFLGLVHVVDRILELVSMKESLVLSHFICVLVSQKLVLV